MRLSIKHIFYIAFFYITFSVVSAITPAVLFWISPLLLILYFLVAIYSAIFYYKDIIKESDKEEKLVAWLHILIPLLFPHSYWIVRTIAKAAGSSMLM